MARLDPAIVDSIRALAGSGHSTKEIGEILGRSAKSVQKVYIRYGIHGLPQCSVSGSRNHFWRNGTTIDRDGYMLIKTDGHPFCNSGGYVRQHRLVMEEHLGRYLLPNEVVHHIDGDKSNNSIENLELYQSNGEHLKMELTGKCPNWSSQGKERISDAQKDRWEKWRKLQSSHD